MGEAMLKKINLELHRNHMKCCVVVSSVKTYFMGQPSEERIAPPPPQQWFPRKLRGGSSTATHLPRTPRTDGELNHRAAGTHTDQPTSKHQITTFCLGRSGKGHFSGNSSTAAAATGFYFRALLSSRSKKRTGLLWDRQHFLAPLAEFSAISFCRRAYYGDLSITCPTTVLWNTVALSCFFALIASVIVITENVFFKEWAKKGWVNAISRTCAIRVILLLWDEKIKKIKKVFSSGPRYFWKRASLNI